VEDGSSNAKKSCYQQTSGRLRHAPKPLCPLAGQFRMSSPIEEKRVLIVDDERLIADTLATIFSNKGYAARPVYSAEQALELISDWLPDLAVIDVQLRSMNGVDLAIRLRVEYPDCKLLLFSGQASTSDLLELAHQKGHPFEIIAKPASPDDLLAQATRLLYPNLR
jgi:CheY-like chemotaxis protein